MVGRDAAQEYYASRPAQKGGMRQEIFDTMAWDNIEEALKDQNKMFEMWYAKHSSGYCDVGYWAIKWEKTGKTTKEEELEFSRCPSCGMRQEKAHHLNRCKNSSRRAVFQQQIQVLGRVDELNLHSPAAAEMAAHVP